MHLKVIEIYRLFMNFQPLYLIDLLFFLSTSLSIIVSSLPRSRSLSLSPRFILRLFALFLFDFLLILTFLHAHSHSLVLSLPLPISIAIYVRVLNVYVSFEQFYLRFFCHLMRFHFEQSYGVPTILWKQNAKNVFCCVWFGLSEQAAKRADPYHIAKGTCKHTHFQSLLFIHLNLLHRLVYGATIFSSLHRFLFNTSHLLLCEHVCCKRVCIYSTLFLKLPSKPNGNIVSGVYMKNR